jgi:serine/threonine protein kinase
MHRAVTCLRLFRAPRVSAVLLQDVFALPNHLALVTEWANCGDLKSYITSYTQDNVRCGPIPRHLCFWDACECSDASSALLCYNLTHHGCQLCRKLSVGMVRSLQGTGIPEKDARCIMQQLLTAVRFAHRHGCATSGIKVRSGSMTCHADTAA